MKHFVIIIAAMLVCSCDDPLEGSIRLHDVCIDIRLPEDAENVELTNEAYKFRNISTGRISSFSVADKIKVMTGLYDVTYTADAHMPNGALSSVKAFTQSVHVTGDNTVITMKAYNSIESDDLIIAEIFFTGTLQPSGNSYYGDDYVKLYNNTGHVIYADGITLFESKFLTTEKYKYTPDIMDKAMTVQALYTVPGSGHDHPVPPGGYLTLADIAIDHRTANPNSFNLSDADFEWYDVSTSPSHLDIDNPDIPNLDKWYCYTQSFWTLHNRGFKAYGIARIPIGKDEYLKDYRYSYDYTVTLEAGTFPMSQTAYMLPNGWIKDVVNCSIEAGYAWNICAPHLDMGWTHCGTIDKDKTRYFRSVRRRMLYLNEQGNPVLKDTNNSSEDFIPHCVPSEIERQGTAMDANGTRCTTMTYDGITPVER